LHNRATFGSGGESPLASEITDFSKAFRSEYPFPRGIQARVPDLGLRQGYCPRHKPTRLRVSAGFSPVGLPHGKPDFLLVDELWRAFGLWPKRKRGAAQRFSSRLSANGEALRFLAP